MRGRYAPSCCPCLRTRRSRRRRRARRVGKAGCRHLGAQYAETELERSGRSEPAPTLATFASVLLPGRQYESVFKAGPMPGPSSTMMAARRVMSEATITVRRRSNRETAAQRGELSSRSSPPPAPAGRGERIPPYAVATTWPMLTGVDRDDHLIHRRCRPTTSAVRPPSSTNLGGRSAGPILARRTGNPSAWPSDRRRGDGRIARGAPGGSVAYRPALAPVLTATTGPGAPQPSSASRHGLAVVEKDARPPDKSAAKAFPGSPAALFGRVHEARPSGRAAMTPWSHLPTRRIAANRGSIPPSGMGGTRPPTRRRLQRSMAAERGKIVQRTRTAHPGIDFDAKGRVDREVQR